MVRGAADAYPNGGIESKARLSPANSGLPAWFSFNPNRIAVTGSYWLTLDRERCSIRIRAWTAELVDQARYPVALSHASEEPTPQQRPS